MISNFSEQLFLSLSGKSKKAVFFAETFETEQFVRMQILQGKITFLLRNPEFYLNNPVFFCDRIISKSVWDT